MSLPQKTAAGFVIVRHVINNASQPKVAITSPWEYLLLQTSYGEHHWTSPKGHVDPGEDLYTTALRETLEEAGLASNDLIIHKDFKKVLNYTVKGVPKEVTYWIAQLRDPQCQIKLSHEHQDLRWLPLEPACKLSGYADMEQVFQAAEKFLVTRNLGAAQ
eukprot:GHVT01097035.1.p2 GENE.GHVT01097035.1~~GHVT01097035.1.p2  ORF type:complete len:160 (+),score=16.73 GHVT01097035.1:872-1351(+)